jgi:hypothetical protein
VFLNGCTEKTAQQVTKVDNIQNCENIGLQTIDSPSGLFKAVVFSRNCGHDTSVNTHISILRSNEALPDEVGNTFVLQHRALPISLRWSDDYALKISGVSVDSSEKQNPNVLGIMITYIRPLEEI